MGAGIQTCLDGSQGCKRGGTQETLRSGLRAAPWP